MLHSLKLLQVIDLCELPPEGALEWCLLLPHVTWRVLVAGGDGTVGWVLSAIDKLKLKVSADHRNSQNLSCLNNQL